nr:uncharacterized protein LOC121130763 [Lepeophtheirus salmonis]
MVRRIFWYLRECGLKGGRENVVDIGCAEADGLVFIELKTRPLPIGDFLWITLKNSTEEHVLSHVIERKTGPDLVSSIIDNRLTDQSRRLKRSGVECVVYIVEGLKNVHKKKVGEGVVDGVMCRMKLESVVVEYGGRIYFSTDVEEYYKSVLELIEGSNNISNYSNTNISNNTNNTNTNNNNMFRVGGKEDLKEEGEEELYKECLYGTDESERADYMKNLSTTMTIFMVIVLMLVIVVVIVAIVGAYNNNQGQTIIIDGRSHHHHESDCKLTRIT